MQAGTALQWLGKETYMYFSDCTDLEVRFTFPICKLSSFYLLILWPWPSFCLKRWMDFPSFCSFPLFQMGLAQSYTMHNYTRSWAIVVLWTHDSDKYHFTGSGSGSDFMIGYPTLYYVEWCKPQSIQIWLSSYCSFSFCLLMHIEMMRCLLYALSWLFTIHVGLTSV